MAYNKESRKNKYPEVDRLPLKAMTIPEFAKQENTSIPYIYKLHAAQKLGEVKKVKIVIFKNYNFVVPL